ncbi:hypothetical protein BS47DRAFT_1340057 [Hydnum rufescens UP504]|uniref:Anthranilate phosphoribosyltransferase n=1 Tax=Hydnum rufescens UP504 TaxID=1448309 RepID=A0A9P6B401_9AGAM|nr:hypothetical protein BS47DRAFT_1340057 [Hydnum rufescens UP504]
MMAHAVPVSVESPDDYYVDIVGTGGDGHNTFNISTAAAIVAAGAGARVIKHGNSASTSSSGSADILRKMGCALPEPTSSPIPAIPFTFLLASHYHPAMARIGPSRRTLPFRTLFNVLGPLINPAKPKAMLLGVADPNLGPVFAQCLHTLGAHRALVVCGMEKLDEISIAGPTWVWSLDAEGQITQFTVDPSDFGVASHPIASVVGSTPQENADVLTSLLNPSKPSIVPSNGSSVEAIRDHILINAAALLVVAGVATSYTDGVERARKSLSDGSAWKALDIFRSQ